MTSVEQLTGRELDEAVAEKVMGWHIIQAGTYRGEWADGPDSDEEARVVLLDPFSSEISAAWLVVERMRELGCDVHVSVTSNGCCCEIYRWRKSGGDPRYTQISSPDAPEAICRAALAAVEGTK